MTKESFIQISDIHIGAGDVYKLSEELENEFLNPLIETFIDEDNSDDFGDLKLIVLTGDLFHRIVTFDEPAGRLAINFVESLLDFSNNVGCQVRFIRGTRSHEHNQLDNMFKKYEALYPNFKIYNEAISEVIADKNILFLPEEYHTNPKEYYKELVYDVEENTYDFVYGHGMINFVSFTGYESDFEKEMKKTIVWDEKELCRISKGFVKFGHVHDWNEYENQIYYVTSFTRNSFADKERKGFMIDIVTDNDVENAEMVFQQNNTAPTYGSVNIDDKDFESVEEKLEYIDIVKEKYDFVRLISNDPDNIKVLSKATESDPTIKLKVKNKKKKDEKVSDNKFSFLIDKSYNTYEEEILQFIKLTEEDILENEVPSIDIIKKLTTEEEVDPSIIIDMQKKLEKKSIDEN